ncbi:hypothetical protein [Nocardiopsis sp. L17-MgMaSL7]|uniref:hypothetical protein n=1 Tax=Nocardiopsis sp. L17-MgMaSL7 TaxID=1938893 RepID=UPI000D93A3B4|nr:hypothetical protein [Nocardiopsis sp. L17-MgMaSL7]PWV54689.1 hypothetical protein BDW27_104152 [Nocardiopsis sp. L17-MgMaSL7]
MSEPRATRGDARGPFNSAEGAVTDAAVIEAENRSTLEAWARAMHATVVPVAENWWSITYQAEAGLPDGTRVRCRYRYVIPHQAALRRWKRTYVVGLVHTSGRARCHHVRQVIPVGDTEPEERHRAELIASALVATERQDTCGASVGNLEVYVVERATLWKPGVARY